jgi:sulfate/thiosulfate transport system substrate-binding protein
MLSCSQSPNAAGCSFSPCSPLSRPAVKRSGNQRPSKAIELLNVSYDPTRELWKDINAQFIPLYAKETSGTLTINQSHGGSSSQARSVIDGLEADVVTLALWSDTDAIRKAGLIKDGWNKRLPNNSLPYTSTIVFVVRKGNPKGIKDWNDLIRSGVEVITPSPKTSGNGKLALLGAWGSVVTSGGSEEDALKFLKQLYAHVPVLDSGARGATVTFAQKKLGDVHLTWENEAHLEVKEAGGNLELVYPSRSIRAEPPVAVVDSSVDQRGTRKAAEAYLNFLYTDAGQHTIAKHFYRPFRADILEEFAGNFPKIELFSIQQVAGSWDQANQKFFVDGGIADKVFAEIQK